MLYEFFLPFTYDLTSVYHYIEIFEKSTSRIVGNGRISEVTPERDLNDFHDIENTITKVCNSRVNRVEIPVLLKKYVILEFGVEVPVLLQKYVILEFGVEVPVILQKYVILE